jgi:hypothetical protein
MLPDCYFLGYISTLTYLKVMESKIIKSSLLEKKDFVPLKAINAKTRLMEAGKQIGKGFALSQKIRLLVLLGLGTTMSVATFSATAHFDLANAQQNKTLMQPQGAQSMATNAANNLNIV